MPRLLGGDELMMEENVMFSRIATLALLAGSLLASTAHATTFDLAGSVGATPTFSITSSGVTATFTSPAGNGFVVGNTSGLISFTPALEDLNFTPDTLTISFSTPSTDLIVLPFAFEDDGGFFGPDSLTVTANNGQNMTFGTTLDTLPLAEPEGTVAFLPTSSVTSITLSTTNNPFIIGNVTLVPEPMSWTLFGAGLVALAAIRRRANAGTREI